MDRTSPGQVDHISRCGSGPFALRNAHRRGKGSVDPSSATMDFLAGQVDQGQVADNDISRHLSAIDLVLDQAKSCRRQEVSGFGAPALLLPEAAEAHGGPQLQRFRLLAAGDV